MPQCDCSLSSKLPHTTTLTFSPFCALLITSSISPSTHASTVMPSVFVSHACSPSHLSFVLFMSPLTTYVSLPPNSFYRCSCQQSCLQQNPAAAQYIKETKASTIA
ncbi:hypothetical protein AMECASPLE_001256 [Ameca splendens]|uniref:Uncharacterized protein n=1 Tax=Ameca splendens TaxID=208324 RepID=A0ABV0XLZ8_9TELE